MLTLGRTLAQIAKRRIRRVQLQWFNRVSLRQLEAALMAAVPPDCPGLFVHSALGRCGYFADGYEAIISALCDTSPNLCMPTHTYCYPTAGGVDPPLFNPRETSSKVGKLTDYFWRMDGVLRSLHPTHSIAALGVLAPELVAGHEDCETPCGEGTPYSKMIHAEFAVLMLGATMNAYTLFHTAEHDAEVPYLYFPDQYRLRVQNPGGSEIPVKLLRQNMTIQRRFAEMDGELEEVGLLRRVPLGRGELLCVMNSRKTHEYLVDALRKNPYHLVSRS